MHIVRGDEAVPKRFRGSAAAIGNFDGLHLGHQSVIDFARFTADTGGVPLGVVTFEPHPRQYFRPSDPPFRLTPADSKARLLKDFGVDVLFEIGFGKSLSQLSSEEFSKSVIAERLRLSVAAVGDDFKYGRGRSGSADTLISEGERFGFGVAIAPILADEGSELSSTAVREALSDGRPGDAAMMLGRPHCIEGDVRKGAQRGRELGFPTANLALDGLHPPKPGVYSVMAAILSGTHKGRRKGVASIGTNPTFGAHPLSLEAYLFDFDGDIYGQRVSVELVEYLRPEIEFRTVEALVSKMGEDCEAARESLAGLD